MKEEVKLTGTPAEMAQQFFRMVIDGDVPLDKLKEIMPVTSEFIHSLMENVKLSIEAEAKSDERFYNAMLQALDTVKEIIKDGKVTDSEREQCIQLIKQITVDLDENKRRTDENRTKLQNNLIKAAVFTVTLIVGAIIGKNKLESKGSNNKTSAS